MRKSFLLLLVTVFTIQFTWANNSKDSVSIYLQKAREFKGQRKNYEADKAFQRATVLSPTDENIRVEYGDYYFEIKKYYNAIEQYAKILEFNFNSAIAAKKLTEISAYLRRWKDVIMYGTKYLQSNKDSKISYWVGNAYFEAEDFGKSQQYLTESIKQDANNVDAIVLLGKVYIELENVPAAMQTYTQAIAVNSNNAIIIYELGLLYYSQNKSKEAVKYFEMAASKGFQQDNDFNENLGMAYLDVDIKKAVEILNKVLEKKPGVTSIYQQIAQAYYKTEKYAEAYEAYNKMYETDKSNGKALFMAGLSLQKKGDKAKGQYLCEQAIKVDPQLAYHKQTKASF